jgi:hypothetical protein
MRDALALERNEGRHASHKFDMDILKEAQEAALQGEMLSREYDADLYGNLAECSTESAPMIGFLAQGSIKPEPSWLVPLRKPKMPENERKSVQHLFH